MHCFPVNSNANCNLLTLSTCYCAVKKNLPLCLTGLHLQTRLYMGTMDTIQNHWCQHSPMSIVTSSKPQSQTQYLPITDAGLWKLADQANRIPPRLPSYFLPFSLCPTSQQPISPFYVSLSMNLNTLASSARPFPLLYPLCLHPIPHEVCTFTPMCFTRQTIVYSSPQLTLPHWWGQLLQISELVLP